MDGVEVGRVNVAARRGHSIRAFELAIAYRPADAKTFGKQIADHQAIAFTSWPRCETKVEAAHLMMV